MCQATTEINNTAIHFNKDGLFLAIKSIARLNKSNFIKINNKGEVFKAQAMTGFISSTPCATA